MWKNTTRLVVWALDNLLDLEDVKQLLEKNYNHSIGFLKDYDIPKFDKELQNKWLPAKGDSIEINDTNLFGQNFKYIEAIGTYETNLGESRSIINGSVLPRSVRVFNHAVKVLFFEFYSRVYCVLELTKSQETRIRSALLGQRRGYKVEKWGAIEFKSPFPFNFTSEFYYWLFSKEGEKLDFKLDNENVSINILDIAAISHLAEKEAYDSSSVGANLLNGSIPALSGLGSNENVYQAGLKMMIKNTNLMIRFGLNGVCFLDTDTTYLKDDEDELIWIQENFKHFVLIVYAIIFPKLLEMFRDEKEQGSWNENHEEHLRKQWALKAIKELMINNELAPKDIANLFENVYVK